MAIRIVVISDTHNRTPKIPDGDLLLHAGDLTMGGNFLEIAKVGLWIQSLPHKYKFVIAGNHDWLFEKDNSLARYALGVNPGAENSPVYLQDSMGLIDLWPGKTEKDQQDGRLIEIWGSPWTPRFFDWAFNLDRGLLIAQKWAKIPEGIDILMTHGPPYGILDSVKNYDLQKAGVLPKGQDPERAGCRDLLERVKILKPKLHVFGHIHVAYGVHYEDGTLFVNAAQGYKGEHKPVVVDFSNDLTEHTIVST